MVSEFDSNHIPQPIKLSAIKKLAHDPESCISLKESEFRLPLQPKFIQNLCDGVKNQLNAMLKKYSERLDGVPMAYDDVHILSTYGFSYGTCPVIYLPIKCTFYLFSVSVGDVLEGVVIKTTASNLGCLVYGMFNVSAWTDGIEYEYEQGDTVPLRVTKVCMNGTMPYITASVEPRSEPEMEVDALTNENDDEVAEGCNVSYNDLCVKKSERRKSSRKSLEGAIEEHNDADYDVKTTPKMPKLKREKKSPKKSVQCDLKLEEEDFFKYNGEKSPEVKKKKNKFKNGEEEVGLNTLSVKQECNSSEKKMVTNNPLEMNGIGDQSEIVDGSKRKKKKNKSLNEEESFTDVVQESPQYLETKKKKSKKKSFNVEESVDINDSSQEYDAPIISSTKNKHNKYSNVENNGNFENIAGDLHVDGVVDKRGKVKKTKEAKSDRNKNLNGSTSSKDEPNSITRVKRTKDDSLNDSGYIDSNNHEQILEKCPKIKNEKCSVVQENEVLTPKAKKIKIKKEQCSFIEPNVECYSKKKKKSTSLNKIVNYAAYGSSEEVDEEVDEELTKDKLKNKKKLDRLKTDHSVDSGRNVPTLSSASMKRDKFSNLYEQLVEEQNCEKKRKRDANDNEISFETSKPSVKKRKVVDN